MTAAISFHRDTVTVVRPALVVERGDEVEDWAAATETDSDGWRLQPMAGVETTGRRDAVTTRLRAFGPADVDVQPRDRIRFAEVVYEIDGPIQRWRSPTGALDHTELTLKRTEG